jgi:NAD(P)H-dependent flavin oxidoreductase YrpB (nitropropane dioxygenase family)
VLQTTFCRELGIEYPIFSVGFGAGAGPELAAAVSNAGGLGVLGTTDLASISRRIARVRELTSRPFGVNVVLAVRDAATVDALIAEAPPVLVLFWGDPVPWVEKAHRQGTRVLIQVGSVDEARAAADAGVDAVIAQGFEAGGHVRGSTALSVFVPEVAEAVRPLPVIASGGVATGRGLVAALALGAQGVSMGTRFVACTETFAAQEFKERVVSGTAEDTVYAEALFDNGWPAAPHRALRNAIVAEWEKAGKPPSGKRGGEGQAVGRMRFGGEWDDVPRYMPIMVTPEFEGDIEQVPLWGGQSVSLVRDIKPAAEIVRTIVREAEETIAELGALAADGDRRRAEPLPTAAGSGRARAREAPTQERA